MIVDLRVPREAPACQVSLVHRVPPHQEEVCTLAGGLWHARSPWSTGSPLIRRRSVHSLGGSGMQGLPGPQGPLSSGGGLYTRWGRTTCPSADGTELLYSGRAGSSSSGTNYVCIPSDPEYSSSNAQGMVWMYGVEYRSFPSRSITYHNAPCAVCYTSSRDTVVMIPAKLTCPSNWTTEYTGYLMSSRVNRASQLECVDQNP